MTFIIKLDKPIFLSNLNPFDLLPSVKIFESDLYDLFI
jgi:hypothetical protein